MSELDDWNVLVEDSRIHGSGAFSFREWDGPKEMGVDLFQCLLLEASSGFLQRA